MEPLIFCLLTQLWESPTPTPTLGWERGLIILNQPAAPIRAVLLSPSGSSSSEFHGMVFHIIIPLRTFRFVWPELGGPPGTRCKMVAKRMEPTVKQPRRWSQPHHCVLSYLQVNPLCCTPINPAPRSLLLLGICVPHAQNNTIKNQQPDNLRLAILPFPQCKTNRLPSVYMMQKVQTYSISYSRVEIPLEK